MINFVEKVGAKYMPLEKNPQVTSIETAEHYVWGENCDGWHLAKSAGLSVIQERVPVGGCEVRHLHKYAEQFFFVLSGVATLEVNGVVHVLKPMQGLHVPANVSHQLINNGDTQLIFLVTSTPPSHGDRICV